MKSLLYFPSIPRYLAARALGKRYPSGWAPLRLSDVAEPEPPSGWVKARVRLAGVCGSDLALLFGKNSPRLSPFFSFPAVLGHEILAEVEGQRVAVNPLLACAERGLEPCPACARGEEGLCENVAAGSLAPGMLGYNRDLPGGWSEWIVARPERLHEVASEVPDERVVLAEPLAVVLRGLRRAFLRGGTYRFPETLLVLGAGTLGLLAVRLLRELGFAGALYVAARHPLQSALARALGADRVYPNAAAAADRLGAKRYRPLLGRPVYRGGFDAVVEAAGSASSLDEAAWMTREGGRVLLLGATGEVRHDFSPHWFSELVWTGSYTYARSDFADAVEMLPALAGLERLAAPAFHLGDWPRALAAARSRRVVKAVFAPQK